jgi:hypothetical protein
MEFVAVISMIFNHSVKMEENGNGHYQYRFVAAVFPVTRTVF